ncbi:MAG: DUF58 domain-containing protein [Bacteroidales bacterium]|nr:DUF58 domain-containing protein [Bacteroidales bacterium]
MKNIDDISELKQFENLELLAKQVVEGFITGLHKSPFHGFSVEFAEHRLYNKGESVRFIDWKLYGRTDKLFVKRFEEETNLRSRIIIDTSSSMLFPYKNKSIQSKLMFSIFSAASLIHLLRKQRDAAGLTFFSDEIELHTQTKMSSVHSRMLYAQLNNLMSAENKLNKKSKPAELLHHISDQIHKRSLVIIFSDMFSSENPEKLFSALQHLKHSKHDVILFHVTDKEHEGEFKYNNRPYKFIDMETGESIKLNPNEVRDYYLNSSGLFKENLKLKCGQYKIDFVQADVKSDFKEILIPYLIKRNKLH